MSSTIGPGYPYPGHAYDPASIWGPATAVPADCRGAGAACRYRSPVGECQRNVLVILSDGVLAEDRGNDAGAGSIPSSAGDPAPLDHWFRAYHDPRGLTSGLDRHGCSINAGIDYRRVDPGTGEESAVALSNCADDLAYSMRSGGSGRPRASWRLRRARARALWSPCRCNRCREKTCVTTLRFPLWKRCMVSIAR